MHPAMGARCCSSRSPQRMQMVMATRDSDHVFSNPSAPLRLSVFINGMGADINDYAA